MSTEVQTIETEAIQKLRDTWANMGEARHNLDLQLQARAQQDINKLRSLPNPLTMADLPKAEAILAEVKKGKLLRVGERTLFTNKFDTLKENLMKSEKSYDEPIKEVSQAIINVKLEAEKSQRLAQAKQDEIRNIREIITLRKNTADAEFKTKVLNMVGNAYATALETDVKPDQIGAYMNKENAKVKPEMFFAHLVPVTLNYVSTEEYNAIANELFVLNSQVYVDSFREQLDTQFSDYSIAYNNKEAALKIAMTEKEEAAKKVENEKSLNQVAAQLESSATPLNAEVGFATKALKKSYEVDMMESLDNSIIVMSAFVQNVTLIQPMMKVNKWDSFNIGQMKNYLGKCKSNDNNFQPTGIIWKEVVKL